MSAISLEPAVCSSEPSAMPIVREDLRVEVRRTVVAGLIVVALGGLLLLQDPLWFWQDDYQSYQLANFRDVARAYQQGDFPLLTPNSWQSGALAGEYQNGVFSVFLTGLNLFVFSVDTPLPLAGAILSLVHLAILAAGTYRLARRRGVDVEIAFVAAWTTAFSGWIMIWGAKAWFPGLASFAWLPWFAWALERSLIEAGSDRAQVSLMRFVPTAFILYLILTAGWPFCVLMAGLWTGWRIAKFRVERHCWLPTWPVIAAWAAGIALAAPALFMLLEYTAETVRGQTRGSHWTDHWTVPIGSLPGFLFPGYVATWNIFGVEKTHRSGELAGGLIPLAAIVCAMFVGGRAFLRKFGWELAFCAIVLGLAIAPSPGNFRWSFRWLPMVSLLLSLLGAHALQTLRDNTTNARPNPGAWAAVLVTLVWLPAWLLTSDSLVLWQGIALTLLCTAWGLVEWRAADRSWLGTWMPAIVAVVSAWVTFSPIESSLEVPVWDPERVERSLPLDREIRYLSVHGWSDLFATDFTRDARPIAATGNALIPGNFNQYAGVEFINGYSPMQPIGLTLLFRFGTHGYIGTPDPKGDPAGVQSAVRLIRNESGPGDLLAMMGVDGLIVADTFADVIPTLETNGWKRQAPITGGTLLHRETKTKRSAQAVLQAARTDDWARALELIENRKLFDGPWVLYNQGTGESFDEAMPTQDYADAKVDMTSESRQRVVAEVTNPTPDRETLVLFSRAWFPGYVATFNGKPLVIERFNLIMPAVRLPHGESGTVVLEYRPGSLERGGRLAFFAVAGIGLIGLLDFSRRRRVEQQP